MNILMAALTLIVAVLTLKKSAVDLKSAQIKLEIEKLTSSPPPATSATVQYNSPRLPRLAAGGVFLLSLGLLVWLGFGAGAVPATRCLGGSSLIIQPSSFPHGFPRAFADGYKAF